MPLNKQTKQMRDSNKAKYGTGYDQVCLHLGRLLHGTAPNAAIRLTVKLRGRTTASEAPNQPRLTAPSNDCYVAGVSVSSSIRKVSGLNFECSHRPKLTPAPARAVKIAAAMRPISGESSSPFIPNTGRLFHLRVLKPNAANTPIKMKKGTVEKKMPVARRRNTEPVRSRRTVIVRSTVIRTPPVKPHNCEAERPRARARLEPRVQTVFRHPRR